VNPEHDLVRFEVDQVVIVEGEAAAGAHAPWARALHLGRVAAGSGPVRVTRTTSPCNTASAGDSTQEHALEPSSRKAMTSSPSSGLVWISMFFFILIYVG
jgi:hypothetical protein